VPTAARTARIDLHTHSTASDGTLTPAEVVTAAAGTGLTVVALTDHDTTAGWAPAAAALPPGLTLVPGAELSCRWHRAAADGVVPDGVTLNGVVPDGAAKPGPGIGLHLLAYLFDPANEPLVGALRRVRESREQRAAKMIDLLRADGLDITWDEVSRYAAGGTVGRPHLAQALIRRGLVKTVSEAFASEWLGRRYRLPKEDIDVFTALSLVRGAGGVPVFAHPRAVARGPVVPDELIVEMAGAGLYGLEADHEDHSPAERAHVRDLAERLGLVVTGSSDFHGANKTVPLGANLTDPAVYERIVAEGTGSAPITGAAS
jgi:predicted metal-dependent phosphoesterase TrpH